MGDTVCASTRAVCGSWARGACRIGHLVLSRARQQAFSAEVARAERVGIGQARRVCRRRRDNACGTCAYNSFTTAIVLCCLVHCQFFVPRIGDDSTICAFLSSGSATCVATRARREWRSRSSVVGVVTVCQSVESVCQCPRTTPTCVSRSWSDIDASRACVA